MKCYPYLIIIVLVASFSACKKDLEDSIPVTTTEQQEKNTTAHLVPPDIFDEQIVNGSEQDFGLGGVWGRVNVEFLKLAAAGLPSNYVCDAWFYGYKPAVAIDHKLSYTTPLPPYNFYEKFQEIGGNWTLRTVGRLIVLSETYQVTADIERLLPGQYRVKILVQYGCCRWQ